MKYIIPILLLLLTISCTKNTEKKVVTITPSLTTENGKWVINLKYSPEIYTHGIIRFYWTVKNTEGKSFTWFGLHSIDSPITEYTYHSGIEAFAPYTVDSIRIIPDDYLDKYTYIIK